MSCVMSSDENGTASSPEQCELRKRGYILGSTLGTGTYAKVKSAYSEKTQGRVAIKIINRKRIAKEFRDKFLPRELKIIATVSHPNIIKMVELMHVKNKVYIAMEHAGHGDLLDFIKLRGPLPDDKAKVMFRQVVDAIDYIHQRGIVHRDLKCENILLDNKNTIKVSDFGFARMFFSGDVSSTFCGSAAYAGPEILQGQPYYLPLHDIWALGVILYIMVCATMPYDDSNLKKLLRDQLEKRVTFAKSKKVSSICKDLVYRILEVNIKRRLTVPQILNHVWMQPQHLAK